MTDDFARVLAGASAITLLESLLRNNHIPDHLRRFAELAVRQWHEAQKEAA